MENLCSKELTTKLWVFISFLQKWRYLSLSLNFPLSPKHGTPNSLLKVKINTGFQPSCYVYLFYIPVYVASRSLAQYWACKVAL